jgi:hypothetical protein
VSDTTVEPIKTAGEVYRGKAPMLYDNIESQRMIILGDARYVSGVRVTGVFYLRENDAADRKPRFVGSNRLATNLDRRYTALCRHGYTQHDSCPGCDKAHDDLAARMSEHGSHLSVRTVTGHTIDLGVIYQGADCTWSAMTPFGDIIATGVETHQSVVRALTLEHKRNAHRLALIEQDERAHADTAPARQAEVDAELLGDSLEIEILVRTLISYGVTTGAQFVAYVEKITAHDDRGTKVARSLSEDQIITAPSAAFIRTMDAFSRIPKMPTSLAALVAIRRDEKGQK